MIRLRVAVILLVFLVSLPSCRAADQPKLTLVTTILPVYCFVANVAGDRAQVENLLTGRADPHDFQFSASHVRKIRDAKLIFRNGLGLESWLDKALQSTKRSPDSVVDLASGLKSELIESGGGHAHHHAGGQDHDHSHGSNPHIWLDPQLARHAVTNVLRALQRADAANAAIYEANARRFLERLERLDAEFADGLNSVAGIPFVTYHDAFPYLVRRYGLNQAGVVEDVPDISPSQGELGRLYGVIRNKNVKVLFTEPGTPPKLAGLIARDLKLRLVELDPLETGALSLTAYEDGMRRNLRALQEGLK